MTEDREPEMEDVPIEEIQKPASTGRSSSENKSNNGVGTANNCNFSGNSKTAGNIIEPNGLYIENVEKLSLEISDHNSSSDKPEGAIFRFGKKIVEEHCYNYELVKIDIQFFKEDEKSENIGIVLDISFGEVEETYISPRQKLWQTKQEYYIKFGIKSGNLRLKLSNGSMPLKNLLFTADPEKFWEVSTVGSDKAPLWQFKPGGQDAYLQGCRQNQRLGTLEQSLEQMPTCDPVEAYFEVKPKSNNLHITACDGLWNEQTKPKERETKIRAFLKKVVEPKTKDYLAKVVLQDDSAAIT